MAGLLDERLSDVEQRLSIVEQRLTADTEPVATVAEQPRQTTQPIQPDQVTKLVPAQVERRIDGRQFQRDRVPDQPDQATGEELLTTSEAAERLGLAFSTLNAAKAKGYIPYRANGWETEPTDQRRGKSALWRVRPIGPGGSDG